MRSKIALGVLVLAALQASELLAQAGPNSPDLEESVADGSFGLGNQDLFVPALAFQPDTPSNVWQHQGVGYWYALNGGSSYAPLTLPAGARISVITCYFHDDAPTAGAVVNLVKYHYNTSTDTPSGGAILPAIVSADAGFHRVFESYDETVQYRPSLFTRQFYALLVAMPSSNQVSFRGCNVTWNRQVSTAPTTATFADVPVGHPYHRFIEALVDSGITAGCGGGLYCVNNPITRGEMAVFLAAALGLHFPN